MPYEKEITKKFFEAEASKSQLPWKLLVFSIVTFVITLFLYFGLIVGYGSYLKSKLSDIQNKIEETGGKISPKERENIINLYSQITNISDILSHHIKSSNFFSFLEKNTVADVYFIKGNYDFKNKIITLEGQSSSYGVLAQQIKAFKNNHFIKNVNLQDTFKKGSTVNFSLLLSFNNNLFNFQNK